jgi:drug/metabolite transporter (DMT)-like permease
MFNNIFISSLRSGTMYFEHIHLPSALPLSMLSATLPSFPTLLSLLCFLSHRESFSKRKMFFFETGFLCIALAVLERTHFVDQTGLKLRNPPASASRVLGLKVCATTPGAFQIFNVE